MEEKNYIQPPYEEEEYDEIDIMELLRKLFREWKLILKWCGVAAIAGLVIGFSIPKEYTVESKMAPESVSRSNSGGSLSSLAPSRRALPPPPPPRPSRSPPTPPSW